MTAPAMPALHAIPLGDLHESPLNPRKSFDPAKLAELTASVQAKGVQVPLVVRPRNGAGPGYEIGAGHRRYRAAKAANLATVPALVREMDDQEFIEFLTFENLERDDLTPLEEAEGYRSLTARGYDVQRIADRIGRSAKYVYDRVKLLALSKEAQQLFREGTITAGHAILLARLSPKDQQRCLGDPKDVERGGLLKYEHTLWDPDHQGRGLSAQDGGVKPVSVRELEAWIDEHVRFDAAKADPMLFPETVGTVTTAKETAEKIVPITHEQYIQPEAREGRTFGPRSWKRADGKKGSKPCEHAVTGVLVVGPGRGEAFKVCVDKDKCARHWGAEKREREKRAQQLAKSGGAAPRDREDRLHAKYEEERKRKEAEPARWVKATPKILEVLAAAVKKAPTKAGGLLASIVIEACAEHGYGRKKYAADYMPRGTSAEDVVRHAAFAVLSGELQEYDAAKTFPKRAKAFGLDVREIVDEVAPAAKAAAAQTCAKRPAKKK